MNLSKASCRGARLAMDLSRADLSGALEVLAIRDDSREERMEISKAI